MTAQAEDRPNVAWCTREQVKALPPFTVLTAADPDLLDDFCMVASTWLWRATGRQFDGPATVTVRPVARAATRGGAPGNASLGAEAFDSRTGAVGYPLGDGRGEWAYEVELGHYPVRSVGQVVVDGAALSASAYRLDDARWLVRTDGATWPWWQDWTRPSAVGAGGTQTGTWEITLTYGADPPPDGVLAAKVLAGELALSLTDAAKCRLPGNVQSLTRQGESMLMVDPQTLIAADRWGIQEIDMFVQAINPNRLTQRSSVLSPDIPRAVRRAGTAPGS